MVVHVVAEAAVLESADGTDVHGERDEDHTFEMITTRGSIFTAYTVGQALQVVGTTTNVLSAARLRSTFEIIPQFANPTIATNDNFAPADASRFAAPTNYTVRTLANYYD